MPRAYLPPRAEDDADSDEKAICHPRQRIPSGQAGWRDLKNTVVSFNEGDANFGLLADASALRRRIDSIKAIQPELRLRILVGAGVPVEAVVSVLDWATRARFQYVVILGEEDVPVDINSLRELRTKLNRR